jgi:hypothetical protein
VPQTVRILLALLTVTLVAAGGSGLRALHLTVETGSGHIHQQHAEHSDAHCAGDHEDHETHTGHDEATCATCELLLTLAVTMGVAVPVPTFHALVAVTDWPAPARTDAPLPIPVLAARPPPTC